MYNLKYDTNEPLYEADTDSNIENWLVIAKEAIVLEPDILECEFK